MKLRTPIAVACAAALTVGATLSAPLATAQTSSDMTIPVITNPQLIDDLSRPAPEVLAQARAFANQPFVPDQLRDAVIAAVEFYEGGHSPAGAPLLKPENTPEFTQFYWPTIAGSCIGGEHTAVGTAIAVPGPADLPLPGVPADEAGFVFTALGTPGLAAEQQDALNVHWMNIDTLQFGTSRLGNGGLNPDGPATLNGTAATGKGTIIAVLEGTVNTSETACHFAPTAAIFTV